MDIHSNVGRDLLVEPVLAKRGQRAREQFAGLRRASFTVRPGPMDELAALRHPDDLVADEAYCVQAMADEATGQARLAAQRVAQAQHGRAATTRWPRG